MNDRILPESELGEKANGNNRTAGTMSAQLQQTRIVMVNTSHPGNIGSAARAMKTMGMQRLSLVAPDDFPSQKAEWMSSGALDVLQEADVFDTLHEAIADCTIVIGASARSRSIPTPMLSPKSCAALLASLSQPQPVAILFGREASGLSNEALSLCHYHLEIPANPIYPVLNIAMAVQVIAYELYQALCVDVMTGSGAASRREMVLEPVLQTTAWDVDIASHAATKHFIEHLEQTLVELNFLDPENPRQAMTRLRRLFYRVHLDEMEVGLLRGMLSSAQRAVRAARGE